MGCWLANYQQRDSRRILVSVWSNQKTVARLKRCTMEHIKRDAGPGGNVMLGPPAETRVPGNIHKARGDKTDSLQKTQRKMKAFRIKAKGYLRKERNNSQEKAISCFHQPLCPAWHDRMVNE